MDKDKIINHKLAKLGTYKTRCIACEKHFEFDMTLVQIVGAYYPTEVTCPHCQTTNKLGAVIG